MKFNMVHLSNNIIEIERYSNSSKDTSEDTLFKTYISNL